MSFATVHFDRCVVCVPWMLSLHVAETNGRGRSDWFAIEMHFCQFGMQYLFQCLTIERRRQCKTIESSSPSFDVVADPPHPHPHTPSSCWCWAAAGWGGVVCVCSFTLKLQFKRKIDWELRRRAYALRSRVICVYMCCWGKWEIHSKLNVCKCKGVSRYYPASSKRTEICVVHTTLYVREWSMFFMKSKSFMWKAGFVNVCVIDKVWLIKINTQLWALYVTCFASMYRMRLDRWHDVGARW